MHEGIPIHNYLVPKEFTHDNGKLTGITFEKVKAEYDAKGRRKLVPAGEPEQHFPCDDVLVAVGQENAFPWIERDAGIEFNEWGLPKLDETDLPIDQSEGVLRRRQRLRPEEHHLGGGARPRGRGVDRQNAQWRGHRRPPAAGGRADQPEDGHPRVVLRQRCRARSSLQGAAARQGGGAQGHQGRGRARLRPRAGGEGSASLPELRRADGVLGAALHRVRRLRRHLPDGLHHLHAERRGSRAAHAAVGAVA